MSIVLRVRTPSRAWPHARPARPPCFPGRRQVASRRGRGNDERRRFVQVQAFTAVRAGNWRREAHMAAAAEGRAADTRVAVLGTGIMGSAMARNLVAAGLNTTVWDRSPS